MREFSVHNSRFRVEITFLTLRIHYFPGRIALHRPLNYLLLKWRDK